MRCDYVNVDDIVLFRFMNERAGDGKAYIPTECEHIANIATHGVCDCVSRRDNRKQAKLKVITTF